MTIDKNTVDCFGLTDVGKVRKVNEDQFLIASMRKVMEIEQTSLPSHTREQLHSAAMARLLLVADGVGGSQAGEEASGLALQTVAAYVTTSMKCFYQLDQRLEGDLMSELESSVQKSHAMVQSAAEGVPNLEGMATTLTVVHLLWPTAYMVQVGDSRCYLYRNEELKQLTKDQTMAQDLVESGVLPAELAEETRWSQVLSSAVGKEIEPVTSKVSLEPADSLMLCTDGLTKHLSMLCTDGLTKHLSRPEIAAHLEVATSAEAACRALVNGALEAGGVDNVTVVVARFDEA
jgi:protein phosphatase